MRYVLLLLFWYALNFACSAKQIEVKVEMCESMSISKHLRKLLLIMHSDTLVFVRKSKNVFMLDSKHLVKFIDTNTFYSRLPDDMGTKNYCDYVDTSFINANRDSVSLVFETKRYIYPIAIEKWELEGLITICIDKIYKRNGYFRFYKYNFTVINVCGFSKRIKILKGFKFI